MYLVHGKNNWTKPKQSLYIVNPFLASYIFLPLCLQTPEQNWIFFCTSTNVYQIKLYGWKPLWLYIDILIYFIRNVINVSLITSAGNLKDNWSCCSIIIAKFALQGSKMDLSHSTQEKRCGRVATGCGFFMGLRKF